MRKKKKINGTSWWFTKPIFFAMVFLTLSSLMTSCSMMQIAAEDIQSDGTSIELETLPTIDDEEIFYLSCIRPDNETFFRCRRLMYDWNGDGR